MRHCWHADKTSEHPEVERLCCFCGKTVALFITPAEAHGPHCPWLYGLDWPPNMEHEECPVRPA